MFNSIQILQVILISLVSTDVSMRESLMWEEAGVLGENQCVQMGDHHNLSKKSTVDHGDRIR